MRSNTTKRPPEDKVGKNRIWRKIIKAYNSAFLNIQSILKDAGKYHFFGDKNDWDTTRDPLTGYTTHEMGADELLDWIYVHSNSSSTRKANPPIPFVYTDDEIKWFRDNENESKIRSLEKSIDFMTQKISEYKTKIESIRNNKKECMDHEL